MQASFRLPSTNVPSPPSNFSLKSQRARSNARDAPSRAFSRCSRYGHRLHKRSEVKRLSCGSPSFPLPSNLLQGCLMCRTCRWVRLNPASSRGRRFRIDPCLRAQLSPRPSTPQPHDRNFERDLYQPLHHGMCRRCNHPNRGRNRRSRRLRPQGGRPNAGFAPLRPHGAQLPVNRCVASLPSLRARVCASECATAV